MKQVRIARSFIAADSLADLIAEEYQFTPPVTCRLFSKMVRTQDNDHYLVQTGDDQKYVARIYQLGTSLERQESDYLFELDWLNFLKAHDRPVSYPLARRDGSYLGSIDAPEGRRYFAVFSFAGGQTLALDDEEQLYRCGAEIAKIHTVSNDYESPYQRQPMDLAFLVDKPVARIKRLWNENRAEDLDLILTSANEAREELITLLENEEETEDSWGPIGGDFQAASIHFDRSGNPTFFNFDLCGYGWRAYDLAVFLLNTNLMHKSTEMSEAFFAGYYSERPLSQNEHAAISSFLTIRRVWLTGMFTLADGLAGHSFIASI